MRPKPTRKGTKAAAAEAAEVTAEAQAVARMEKTKSLAAEYEAIVNSIVYSHSRARVHDQSESHLAVCHICIA